MRAIVLGAAAGGGVPQWNCRCPVCRLARVGDARVLPRTQSSLAVTADGRSWLLVNASPDLREQLAATPALHPREGVRDSPGGAVLLTGAEVDAVAGLLTLRERQPFALHATAETLDALARNPIFGVLDPALVPREVVVPGTAFEPVPGLRATLFSVPGKAPLWAEGEAASIDTETGGTVGLEIEADGRRVVYLPGCAAVTDGLRDRLDGADALLFDGTVYTDDELAGVGVGTKTGRRMGHVAVTGADGSLRRLADLRLGRRIFVHLNNTNPVLIEDSPERRAVEAAGWEVATDGMVVAP